LGTWEEPISPPEFIRGGDLPRDGPDLSYKYQKSHKTMNNEKAGKKSVKTAILILLAALAFYTIVEAVITITVTGSWSLSIGQANLSGAAGSDLTASYESAANQLLMTIGGTGGHSWRVDVYRVDSTWNASFVLSIKRTTNGTPSGKGAHSIDSIGLTYAAITTVAATFWSGIGDYTDIPLQYQLSGVSCAIPAASYSTTIRFTVVQTN
jgi:hypothetical protein